MAASYTGEKNLSIDDLKRLRDQYNSSDEFTDMSFMNELFHGLDDIIDAFETRECCKTFMLTLTEFKD